MIYSLHADYRHFQIFTVEGKEARKALGEDTVFHMDPTPISYIEQWQTMEIDFFSESGQSLPSPDITQCDSRLFVSQKAFLALEGILSAYGEFLPVTSDSIEGYLFNPLTVADFALDTSKCLRNEWGDISWLEFDEDLLHDEPVFRTEFDDYFSVFCSQQFKDTCESAGLTGLVFSQNLAPEPP